MNKLFRLALTMFALVFFLSNTCLSQISRGDVKNFEVERLLKSLDENSWIVGETRYGLDYNRDYLDLRQTTLNSPNNEIGNKWYWMIYPLSNIDNLWNNDIQPFYPKEPSDTSKHSEQTPWEHISGSIQNEQKCVFMLLPKVSVVSGRAGVRPKGSGYYDFGQYLRITEIRVHKEKIGDFESFLADSFVPTANAHLPKRTGRGRDKLPRYLRVVKIKVNMSKEPDFLTFLRGKLVPAAQKARENMLVYHTIYGSEANYLLLFPFENEDDLAATGERVLSALWQKTHSYFEMLQVDSYFAGLIMGASETIIKVRPELSPSLENKYSRWWK
jgi:hypothetical protein